MAENYTGEGPSHLGDFLLLGLLGIRHKVRDNQSDESWIVNVLLFQTTGEAIARGQWEDHNKPPGGDCSSSTSSEGGDTSISNEGSGSATWSAVIGGTGS